jgi:MFS family permease
MGIFSRLYLPAGFVALRERNYTLYVVGQFTSQLGSWIEMTAVAWIIYEMTDSPFLLGLNGLFRAGPMILLALFGGAVADRVQRRSLLLCTETTMLFASLTMGILAATGKLEFWHLYVLNLVSGTLNAFSVPARQALFAGLVPRSSLHSAVTLNGIAVRSAGFVGPSVAGLALAYGGYSLPFLINATSFLGMLGALLAMQIPPLKARSKTRPGIGTDMVEGVAFVWRNPLLRVALGLEIASGLFGHNSTLVTIVARDLLGTGPQGLGLLLSAIGVGALCGMAAMVTFEIGRNGRLILTLGAVYAILWATFALSHSFWFSAALLCALGVTDSIWGVTRNTLAQMLVPDALRGRVMSVVVLSVRGSSQLGRVQSGFLVGLLGAPAAILVGSSVLASAVAASWRLVRQSRNVTLSPAKELEAEEKLTEEQIIS